MKAPNIFSKRIISLFLALLMLTSMPVISFAQEDTDTLSEEKINRIRHDFEWSAGSMYDTSYVAFGGYFGSYNGYDIVYMIDAMPALQVITNEVIAGYTFTFGNSHAPYCFIAYKDGGFCTVKEAYNAGYLSKSDIAAIHERFTGLDRVKKDYVEYLKNVFPDDTYIQSLGVDDIVIDKYYGVYDGYKVVLIRPKGSFGNAKMLYLEIGEYTFEFPSEDDIDYFLAYKDGEFTSVKDAYDAREITDYSISKIYEEHTGDRIRREFAEYCAISRGRNVDYEDVWFADLGEYNGYRAFRMIFKTEASEGLFSDIGTYAEPIAGCIFTCTSDMPYYGITLYNDGKFISLADAYATFLVSERDVERIFMKDVGNTLYERLSQKYVAYLNEQYPENSYYQSLTADDIVIDKHLARYDFGTDCHIILIYPEDQVMTDDILELEIAGYTFTFPSGSMIDHFLVYKDGEFARVKDAYESGMIQKEWVAELYQRLFAEKEWNNPFSDVDEESWYYDSVKYVYQNGLFVGVSDRIFAPSAIMTKNMFITVLWSYSYKPILSPRYGSGIIPMPGDTISLDAWYYQPLRWAAVNGMIKNNEYSSRVPIFRSEIMQILYKYYMLTHPDARAMSKEEVDEILSVYPDKGLDRERYDLRVAAAWAVKNGLIVGIPQGDEVYLSVSSIATRAQVATVIKNFTLKNF